jgi:hypothetical protein
MAPIIKTTTATEILKTVTISAEVNMKVILNNNTIFMPLINRNNTIILIENIYKREMTHFYIGVYVAKRRI